MSGKTLYLWYCDPCEAEFTAVKSLDVDGDLPDPRTSWEWTATDSIDCLVCGGRALYQGSGPASNSLIAYATTEEEAQ